ncbi:MAG: UDP-4-amino-4,6-dideoxy-N-acetyl-beta-L-altrosamine transaminase [Halothiobacillus sp.]|nr:UDP-4-amino-4,6-dideoxy-N-acetyl-beta-L-altrosamine transaminase [Halothiobacillus sp.]
MIPYGRQDISDADIQAVVDVLRSDYLTQGPAVPAFEKSIADYCGAQHAIAVNSATSALHIACLALDVRPNDLVWTTPITFVASANCALYCGAQIDFVDIDSRTYNMSVERLAEKLAHAEKIGKLPKVVIPVHLCGQPCDMVGIHALGQQYGFKIIEDAAHAIGGKYRGEPIGNCRYSDITVFSFHPVKIITSGEGGMALTNDAQLAKRLRLLRSHGISSDEADMQPRPSEEIWNYQQIGLGFNYRMTDILAALGLSQMQRLDEFVAKRHSIAERYDQLLSSLPVVTPFQHADGYSSFHLYVIRLKLGEINKTHRQVYEALRAVGILVNLHYIPVYRQPYYVNLGFEAGYCPEAEQYYSEVISIPVYPGLTEAQQDQVVAALRVATSL